MKDFVLKIHSTPHKAVLAITGGGSEVIGELLRYGSGSNTLLEAIIPYDPKSFDSFVKGSPDKYCSPGAARDLAMASYQRAIRLAGLQDNLIGIGVSCSLGKDNERVGREHNAYIAVQTKEYTRNYEIHLTGLGYSRTEEESLVARVVIGALGYASGLRDEAVIVFEQNHVTENFTVGKPEIHKLLTGQLTSLTFGEGAGDDRRTIFAGSFNPFHEGHKNIAEKVFELTGKPVDLEICVHNVDKPALNYTDLNERLKNLQELQKNPWCGLIHLTALPTFLQKAENFYGATFVVGWDTFKRISDPKYGKIDDVITMLQGQESKFIVFHRVMDGKASQDEGTEGIHWQFLKMAQIISPEILPPLDISSSKIRKGKS